MLRWARWIYVTNNGGFEWLGRSSLARWATSGRTGARVDQYMLPDTMVTNVCFGGREPRAAYATPSMGGTLVSFEWPRPGLALNHLS